MVVPCFVTTNVNLSEHTEMLSFCCCRNCLKSWKAWKFRPIFVKHVWSRWNVKHLSLLQCMRSSMDITRRLDALCLCLWEIDHVVVVVVVVVSDVMERRHYCLYVHFSNNFLLSYFIHSKHGVFNDQDLIPNCLMCISTKDHLFCNFIWITSTFGIDAQNVCAVAIFMVFCPVEHFLAIGSADCHWIVALLCSRYRWERVPKMPERSPINFNSTHTSDSGKTGS